MQNLAVVFPKPESGYPTTPYIDKDIQIAHPEERINWKFYSLDNTIKYVEIEFTGGEDFFGENSVLSTYGREFKKRQAIIYGDVPDASSLQESKYTIRGYDKDPKKGGVVLSELDPKIVTAVP
jgi:hypothetical protein